MDESTAAAPTTQRPVPSVTVTRGLGRTLGWAVAGGIGTYGAWWLVLDTRGHFAAWALLIVLFGTTSFFALQAAWPGGLRIDLTHDELRARHFWRPLVVPWHDVDVARVRKTAGETLLILTTRSDSRTREARGPDPISVLVPTGGDIREIHRFLERRLGRRLPVPDVVRTIGED